MSAVVVLVAERAEPSQEAIAASLRECRLREATLHVVCVIPLDVETGKMAPNLREAFEHLERKLLPMAASAGIEVRMHVTGFFDAQMMVSSICRLGAQVVVMSHSPRRRIWGLKATSLANKMLDFLPCTVIVTA
jgi:nucleotide-binding universal stress UspA family protein